MQLREGGFHAEAQRRREAGERQNGRARFRVFLALAAVAWLFGCHSHPHDDAQPVVGEEESIADTVWNERFELFMEYPPIRVGEPVDFLAHLTDLPGRGPVTEGPVDFRFSRQGREVQAVSAAGPLRPGIFRVEARFDSSGPLDLVIEVRGGAQQGHIQASPLTVFETAEELPQPEETSTGQAEITFLKEQQWTLPFDTAEAAVRRLSETVSAAAEVIPVSGRDIQLRSSTEGVYRASPAGSPRLAQKVKRGQLLGWIELTPDRRSGIGGSQIQAGLSLLQMQREIAQAEAAAAQEKQRLEQAKRRLQRLERLLAVEAVPPRRVEEARSEVAVRQAALQAARQVRNLLEGQQEQIGARSRDVQQLGQRIPLHSPIGGRVAGVWTTDGAVVDPRQPLLRILDLQEVWIRAQVVESQSHRLGNLEGAALELAGRQQPLPIAPQDLVSVGSVVDPASRTVPVLWEAANPDGLLKAGMLGQIHMRTGAEVPVLAVPSSAVLVEDNKSVLYLQLEGESFSRRIVTTGMRDRGWVQIVQGLEEGERVVVKGAYEVALAARAGDSGAAHGHVH